MEIDDDGSSFHDVGGDDFTEADAEKLGTLLETVLTTPYKYGAHMELLALLQRAGSGALAEELKDERERVSNLFLMGEEFWMQWIREELPNLQGDQRTVLYGEALVNILELYSRGIRELFSVELWKQYIDFVLSEWQHESRITNKITADKNLQILTDTIVEGVLTAAVEATAYAIPDSHIVWNTYRDFHMQKLKNTGSAENIQLMKSLYLARLKIPHVAISETFSDYSTMITEYDNKNYEKELVSANKIVHNSREILSRTQKFEDYLAHNPEDISAWAQYIDVARGLPKKLSDREFPKCLFERALRHLPTASTIWEAYIFFLLELKFPSATVYDVCERAVKACPRSGALWAQAINVHDTFGSAFGIVEKLKNRAFATGLLDSSAEEYSQVAAEWTAYLRRRLDNAKAEDNGEGATEFLQQVDAIVTAFDTTFPIKKRKDSKYILPQMYISILTRYEDFEKARDQWEVLTKSHAQESEFWIKRIEWEKRIPNALSSRYSEISTLYMHAVTTTNVDSPEILADAWIAYERDYGSAYALGRAFIRAKKATRIAQRRRALRAATMQEHAETAAVLTRTEITAAPSNLPSNDEAEGNSDTTSTSLKHKATPADGSTSEASRKKQKLTESTEAPSPLRDREHSTVIAEGFHEDVTEEQVSHFFQDCGNVKSIKIMRSGGSATATLEFESKEDVLAALTRDQKKAGDSTITVRVGNNTTLWITNFPSAADEAYIRALCEPFGEILDIRFPSLSVNNKRRFCYLQYTRSADAVRAQQALDDSIAAPIASTTETPSETPQDLTKVRKLIVKISDPSQKQRRHGAVYDGRELFVRNIPISMKESAIRELFERHGTVARVHLPSKDDLFHAHQGFGFVTYENVDDAKNAVEALNMVTANGRALNVSLAEVKTGSAGSSGLRGGIRGGARGGFRGKRENFTGRGFSRGGPSRRI
ncbi:uncharacterized protein V1518DRAFT_369329 [Limtongia smithiae]|uniref:uncharacterized protein n=1 Tax=Limtongia smithiae TaxID=1125753 RepID=UPI0034CFFD17